jgi:hypothetical protein
MKTSQTFLINQISLISSTEKPIDITESYETLTIIEQLFGSGTYGSIQIVDSEGILETLPFIGEETLYVEFLSNGNIYSNVFTITEVNGITKHSQKNDVIQFNCNFYSSITEKNINQKYSYAVSNSEPGEIIEKLFETKLGTSIEVEKTLDSRTLAFVYKHPFDIVHQLTLASNSADGYGDYVLFENSRGWHWKTLRHLISQDPTSTFTLISNALAMDDPVRNMAIKAYRVNQLYNTVNGSDQSLYSAGTHLYSIINRSVETIGRYRDWDKFESAPHLGNFPKAKNRGKNMKELSSEGQSPGKFHDGKAKLLDKFGNISYNYTIRSNEPESSRFNKFPENNLMSRMLYASISQEKFQIDIEGNTDVTVGDITTINIATTTSDEKLNNLLSGKYLIIGCMHVISPNKIVTSLTLSSDYLEKEPDFND